MLVFVRPQETAHPHATKAAQLRAWLGGLDDAVICFSGGVDSSYLLAEAASVLGTDAVALTAVSPSLAEDEGAAARSFAARLGVRHVLVETYEVDDPRYAANPVNRCYFCKTEVYGKAVAEARRLGMSSVLDGFNVDDRSDYRPGRQAAREQGVRSPLDELGFTKSDIRDAARQLGLPVWNKPALACLSSRFPYGTSVTPERLTQVAACERVLKNLGFKVCRVRYYGPTAKIEVAPHDIPRLERSSILGEVERRFREAGFEQVDVDPRGYRAGGMNEKIEVRRQTSEGRRQKAERKSVGLRARF